MNDYVPLLFSQHFLQVKRKKQQHYLEISLQDHVVQYIDYFEGEQQSVILTEYLEGGELFQRISSPDYNLTEAKCRDFTRQILDGIDFIHSKRIIHLDLKPQNIVLCRKLSNSTNESNSKNGGGGENGDSRNGGHRESVSFDEELKIIGKQYTNDFTRIEN